MKNQGMPVLFNTDNGKEFLGKQTAALREESAHLKDIADRSGMADRLMRVDNLEKLVDGWGPGKAPNMTQADAALRDIRDSAILAEAQARRFLCDTFAFQVVTSCLVKAITEMTDNMKIADVGCGSGYLASLLSMAGSKIVGVDLPEGAYGQKSGAFLDKWVAMDGVLFMERFGHLFDAFILSWPPYEDPFGANVLERIKPGQIVLHQGEWRHGCTGDDRMFDLLENLFEEDKEAGKRLSDTQPRWPGIHDYWSVHRRK